MCFKQFIKGIKSAGKVISSGGMISRMWCSTCWSEQPVYRYKGEIKCCACHSTLYFNSAGFVDVEATDV